MLRVGIGVLALSILAPASAAFGQRVAPGFPAWDVTLGPNERSAGSVVQGFRSDPCAHRTRQILVGAIGGAFVGLVLTAFGGGGVEAGTRIAFMVGGAILGGGATAVALAVFCPVLQAPP